MSENEKHPGDEVDRWPEDEAPASEAERHAAERFADALDRTGEASAAVDREQAELHAAAAILRATVREEHLERSERDRLVREAIDERFPGVRPARGLRRLAPALALAASVLILLGSLLLVGRGQLSTPRSRPRSVPQPLTSRSSNDLIGRPIEDRAGAARRLDLVFADRLAGYRRARLASGGQP